MDNPPQPRKVPYMANPTKTHQLTYDTDLVGKRDEAITLDGKPIAHLVTAIRFDHERFARNIPTITLDLVPGLAARITGKVEIDADTEELLLHLGWTPPSVTTTTRP